MGGAPRRMLKEKLKIYLKEESTGWRPPEIAWLGIATAVILGLSLYWQDNFVSITAALTGVWCVILTGKGKRSSFLFGIVNVLFYAADVYKRQTEASPTAFRPS